MVREGFASQTDDNGEPHPRRSSFPTRHPVVLGAVAAIAIALVQGPFQEMTEEFGMPVPLLTLAVLSPAFPLALAAIVLATIAKEFFPQARSIASGWNAIALCAVVLFLGAFIAGMLAPLFELA